MSPKKFHKKLEDDDHRASSTTVDTRTHEDAVHEVVESHLDVMLEIIMMIREDPGFAQSIYAGCPRLQHLLDEHPDLRPVFEDQNLVRINFEQVYKKAGGVLPEDKPSRFVRALACIVNHPLFKVLRFLLLIKKCYNCIIGGGFALVRAYLCSLCAEQAAGEIAGHAMNDPDGHNGRSPEYEANHAALNAAADHMEDPEMQERLQAIIDGDPDKISEAIEADPELRALRDSNPLCAELMSDQGTMKILTDPYNLRALAEAPELIQQDFADPNWTSPYIENGEYDAEAEGEDEDGALLEDFELGEHNDGEEEGGLLEAFEPGEHEGGEVHEHEVDGFEEGDGFLEDYEQGKSAKRSQEGDEEEGNRKGGGGFFSSLGAGLVDYVAAETIGITASEMLGGNDDLLGAADEVEQQAENAENVAAGAVATAEFISSDEVGGNLEDTLDTFEEAHDKQETTAKAAASGAAVGVAVGGRSRGVMDPDGEQVIEDVSPEKPKKKGIFRIGGRFVSAMNTTAKEYVVGQLLGDDFAADLVERIEERNDGKEEGEEAGDDEEKQGGEELRRTRSHAGRDKKSG